MANPSLSEGEKFELTRDLMDARRRLKGSVAGEVDSKMLRDRVNGIKVALGERGPVWWTDGTPDLNRRLAKNTPYADWYARWLAKQDA